MSSMFLKLYLTLIVQRAVAKLENDNNNLSFINVYCGAVMYSMLSSYEYTLDNGKKIYFVLDTKKEPHDVDLESEEDKNIIKFDEFFENDIT